MKICNLPIAALVGWTCLIASSNAAEGPFVFRDVASELGIAQAARGMMAHAAAWGDVDRDGKPDLWIGSFADRPDELYKAGGADGPVPPTLRSALVGATVTALPPVLPSS